MTLDGLRVAILQESADAAGRERQAEEIAAEARGAGDRRMERLALIVAGGARAGSDAAMLLASVIEPAAEHLGRRGLRARLRAAWAALRA